MDAAGRLVKVVKFATDVTPAVSERLEHNRLQNSIDGDLDPAGPRGLPQDGERTSPQAPGAASRAQGAATRALAR